MSVVAIALILAAAVIHATWNALAKRSGDPLAFLWSAVLVSLAVYALPFAILLRRDAIEPGGWIFIVLSGLLHVGYFVLLARAYERADLSLAYPIARGTGLMLVPVLAIPIFGIHPTAIAWLGIGGVIGGVIWLHAPALTEARKRAGGLLALFTGPATLTGFTIAAYSLTDAAGVKRVDPLVYLYLTFTLVGLLLAPYLLVRRRTALRAAIANRTALIAAGIGLFGTYTIILLAMQLAPVSYVVPMREVSIVAGALIGMRFLDEPRDPQRLGACGIVALGVIAIGLGG